MYCGNCGKEIAYSLAFCPECGTKVEIVENGKTKINNQKMKKQVIPVLVVIIVAFIGIKIFSYIQSIPSKEEIQRATNNVQNGALVASDGKWIYYNDSGLCKIRLKEGTGQVVVSNNILAENMFCVGNKLYYYSFPGYYELKGRVGKDLGFSVFTENCIQSDGKKFYVTGSSNYEDGGVYSADVGNIKKSTKISDIQPTRILLQGEYLYVISGFGSVNDLPNENYGTWKMNKTGKDSVLIFDYCPAYIVFSGDQMYYTNKDRTICSANLDGSDEIIYEGAVVNGGLNVSEDYIFYIDKDSQMICRMDKDGSNKMKINNNRSYSLNIVEDWIFYQNQDYDYEIYKMSFDGNYNQPIY